jgi:methylenetetrahydrofolate dehydrogenase (NADP+)/methenyltetrahydrofolate cyclohydrolase
VVIFDAGTSEDGGVIMGDVHPDVANKASVFTPVPGGIGPITIAYLLSNLAVLASQ